MFCSKGGKRSKDLIQHVMCNVVHMWYDKAQCCVLMTGKVISKLVVVRFLQKRYKEKCTKSVLTGYTSKDR